MAQPEKELVYARRRLELFRRLTRSVKLLNRIKAKYYKHPQKRRYLRLTKDVLFFVSIRCLDDFLDFEDEIKSVPDLDSDVLKSKPKQQKAKKI